MINDICPTEEDIENLLSLQDLLDRILEKACCASTASLKDLSLYVLLQERTARGKNESRSIRWVSIDKTLKNFFNISIEFYRAEKIRSVGVQEAIKKAIYTAASYWHYRVVSTQAVYGNREEYTLIPEDREVQVGKTQEQHAWVKYHSPYLFVVATLKRNPNTTPMAYIIDCRLGVIILRSKDIKSLVGHYTDNPQQIEKDVCAGKFTPVFRTWDPDLYDISSSIDGLSEECYEALENLKAQLDKYGDYVCSPEMSEAHPGDLEVTIELLNVDHDFLEHQSCRKSFYSTLREVADETCFKIEPFGGIKWNDDYGLKVHFRFPL